MYCTSVVANRGQSARASHPVSRVYQRGRAAPSTQSTGQRQRANNSTRNRKLGWSPDRRLDPRPVVSVSAEASSQLETQSLTMSGTDGNAPSPAVQPGSVVVLTTIGCPYCKRAKAMLKDQGVSYSEIDLSMDRELLQEVKKMTGRSTVPQVFIGSKLVGGADELKAAVEAGELPELLKKAKESGEGLPAQLAERLNVTSGKPTGLAPPNRLTPERFAQMKDVAAKAKASKSLIQNAKVGRMQAENVFKGSDLLKWLQDEKLVENSQQAIEMAEDLKKAQVMTAVDDSCEAWVSTAWHRLVADAPKPKKAGPMNAHYNWFGTAREGSMVANALREFILRLYDKHLAPDGKAVDYKALATDPEFQAYVDATAELQKVRVEEMPSREERISFFVNIYNALVIHATAVLGAPDGLFDRLRFFSSIEYIIGGHPYSCDDIEHGILRDNAVSPASLGALVGLPILSRPWFKRSDPRLAFKVSPEDPRIHFGLVCGAKSCPPIKLYTPDNLDEGLQAAATAFCEAEVDIDRASRTVTMSKIFKWYGGDFGSSQNDQLKAITEFLPPEKKQEMLAMLECDGNVSVKFKHYDWAVNSK